MKNVFFLSVLLSLASCASAPLSKAEQEVKILRKSDADKECKEMGRVTAPGMMSLTEEGRDADLKRAAYALGGDTVTILNRDSNNTVFGMAFKCNSKAATL